MSGQNPSYPPRIMEFARRLYEGGRSINHIREQLAQRGWSLSRETVRYWVDEEYREEKLHRQRRYRPPGPAPKRGWRKRLDRMEDLRGAGLSYTAIAAVMTLDYDELEIDTEQARSILKRTVSNRTIKQALWPKGEAA